MIGQTVQIAHVELGTPSLDASTEFFCELLGMQESDRSDGCVYLRCYEDRYHHSLKLTAAAEPGLLHIGLRLSSPTGLQAAVESAAAGDWGEGDRGVGRSFRTAAPTGHTFELFHDVEYYAAPDEQRSVVLNRAQRRPEKGVPLRRLDHVNVFANDVGAFRGWVEEHLPFQLREQAVTPKGDELGAWLSGSSLMHDLAAVHDASDRDGRLHHVGFWYGSPQHLWDVADLLIERGHLVEHGPGKHGVTQSMFLYVIEPGGNRIELFGDVGQLVFDPTWQPIIWVDDGSSTTRSTWIGNQPPATFHSYGTPPASSDVLPEKLNLRTAGWIR